MRRFGTFSTVRLTTYFMMVLSAIFIAASVYMTFSIDVLKDWTLTLPQQEVHAKDTITIQSVYTKVMSVKGESFRYLDCKNKNGITIRYPLNQAIADRAAQKGGTGVVVIMPDNVPDLPAKCKVSVVIDYPVLPWRHVIETQETKEFTLLPARTASAVDAQSAMPGTSQTQPQVTGQSSVSSSQIASSSSQSEPSDASVQRDSSQSEVVREETVNPQQTITGIPLIDGVIRGLGL